MDAWNWIPREIKGGAGGGEWLHADSLGAMADVFGRTFALMGSCRFPLYVTPAMAREWFQIWKLINECRMGRQGWSLLATSEDPSISQPALKLF